MESDNQTILHKNVELENSKQQISTLKLELEARSKEITNYFDLKKVFFYLNILFLIKLKIKSKLTIILGTWKQAWFSRL